MIDYGEGGTLRVKSNNSYLEHKSICRDFKDKLSLVEYRHKYDGTHFCEYDTRGLVSLLDYFVRGKKASADDLLLLMHGVLLTLICGKKVGLFENSFVLTPEFVFARRSSLRPKLVYLPMETGFSQAEGYKELIRFLTEVCDESTLSEQLMSALVKIGYNLNEAALVVVDAANNKRISEKYLDKQKQIYEKKSPLFSSMYGSAKIQEAESQVSDTSDESIELLETTCLYDEEPRLYLLDGKSRHEIEINSDVFILGRKKDTVSYCFEGEKYKGISRLHATIKFDGTSYFIEDIGSSGGTFVNGKRIIKGHLEPLTSGDEIRLYNTKLLFE